MYNTYKFNAAGVTFGKRQRYLCDLENCIGQCRLFLWREPANKTDSNAIKIVVAKPNGKKYAVGYIPKTTAAKLAPIMDNGGFVAIDSFSVVGGHGLTRGLTITAHHR